MRRLPDEFEIRARSVLGTENRQLLAALLALRTDAQRAGRAASSSSADALNAQNQRLFDQAAKLLGPEKFDAIFGGAPYQKVDLVDPSILESSRTSILDEPATFQAQLFPRAAAAAPPAVTLKHLAANVAQRHRLSKGQAEAILGGMVDLVVSHLKKGDRIRIGGLGILQVRKRAARMGRNPATGERVKIKASKKVAFRAAKELRNKI